MRSTLTCLILSALAGSALANPSPMQLAKRFTFPLPESKGSETFDEPKTISGAFDGEMKTYGRGASCESGEGGDDDAVFLIEDGGSLSNAIIGEDQMEGVHCQGSCTIENVWWAKVCEGKQYTDNGYIYDL